MNRIDRIAIVGSGAVGAYYGARLAAGGDAQVSFLMRRDLDAVNKSGLKVHSVEGDFTVDPVSAFGSTAAIGPVDLVIIALKATSNGAIPTLLPPLLQEGTRILTLQNGLGNEEFLQSHFPDHPIIGGLCFVCINRGEPGVIHHLAHGRVEMGELTETVSVEQVHDLFVDAGLHAKLLPNLGLARWRKLIWNIPFNGLSISEGCIDTKRILADSARVERVRTLMHEIIAAAAAFGYEIDPAFAESNISGTAEMGAYRPSSLIDFEEGKSVEVEPIWGEPLRRGREAGIPMPELS
ncbi:MAG: 2-dehydropantoate 2-reductase, partial [Verrucomicrobiota bacterium]